MSNVIIHCEMRINGDNVNAYDVSIIPADESAFGKEVVQFSLFDSDLACMPVLGSNVTLVVGDRVGTFYCASLDADIERGRCILVKLNEPLQRNES